MRSFVSRFAATLALCLALAGGVLFGSAVQAAESQPPKLFIVLTSAEPQVQGMAMILGLQALSHGSPVRVLLCGSGGDVALKGAPQTALKPVDKSPQQLLQALIAKGATAEVCGLYLPNSGQGAEALIEGVSPVKPPVIGAYMAEPDVRFFTF